jgi:type IV pilus assembly protein PilV
MAARLATGRRASAGFTLVEVLVSVVIFSIGVLGLVRLQATAVKMATDARQRAEATFLADQLLARMLISDPATASTFAHHPDTGSTCAPGGAASTNALVTDWLAQVAAAFPRASADAQQIVVAGVPANEVTVRLCWKNGENDDVHRLEVTNRVQWP